MKFIKKFYYQNSFLLNSILIWRLGLILISSLAIFYMPLGVTDRYLGGGYGNYISLPHFFGLANFDGEHYIAIAIFGYKKLEYAFFPVYPILIHLLSNYFYLDLRSSLISAISAGLLISNLSFALSLFVLHKLLRFDYDERTSKLVIILLLLFPTSFYFGIVYSESIFFLLLVSIFYFARRKHWYVVFLLGIIATASRVFGVLLIPALLFEAFVNRESTKTYILICLTSIGLIGYMLYQYLQVGDPLAFYHLQTSIGPQRQADLILYPQVVYRYLKILTHYPLTDSLYQTLTLEFITGITFFVLPILGNFKKVRKSYLIFSFLGLLISPFQGSFSSVPRYAIILFPSFIVFALYMRNFSKLIKVLIFILLGIMLSLEFSLFLRGYWVA